jgi:hypothetical protein
MLRHAREGRGSAGSRIPVMAYTKPVIEECEETEDVVFYAFETIYVFRSTGSWPAHYFFWTATEEAWLAGDYEFERRKY